MDFGPHTLQIVVSSTVVLAAAGVALVCDVLKRNNEHLRELAVELKVRNEEAERRVQAMESKGKRLPDLPAVKPADQVMMAAPAVGEGMSTLSLLEETRPEELRAPSEAAPRTSRPQRQPRRAMSPAVAAVAQAASAIVNNNREHQSAFATASSSSDHQTITSQASSPTGRRKNWDSILKRTSSPRQPAAVIPFESIREAVPAGFHDASVLQRSVESGRTLSGLVISIGTNAVRPAAGAEVVEYLQAQLSGLDFACQLGADEYILICCGEQDAAAQRRLSLVAEKLWDFQLSSIGGLDVQFSWGSFEARGERIGEAVATAIEQMQDTRQFRRGNIAKAV